MWELTDKDIKCVPRKRRVNQHATDLHEVAVINVIGPLHSQVDILEEKLHVN